MGLIYDIAVVLIIVITTAAAIKKGFVYTLVNFAGYVVSFFASFILSRFLSEIICTKLIAPSLYEKLAQSIQSAGNDIAAGIDRFMDSLPAFLSGTVTIPDYGAAGHMDVSSVASSISDNVIMPAVISIVSAFLFVVIFSLLLFIVRRAADITKFVRHIPVIGFVNKILGGVMGAVKGMIIAYIFFCAVGLLSLAFGDSVKLLSHDVIYSSYIFNFINSIKLV